MLAYARAGSSRASSSGALRRRARPTFWQSVARRWRRAALPADHREGWVRKKIPVLLAVLLTYAFQLTVFMIARTELAYSYHHRFGDLLPNLPALTVNVALPILGPGGLDGSPMPLFYVFWTVVFLPPAILAWRTWTQTSDLITLQRFVYWGSSYALVVGLAYLLVLFGLWLPFSAA